jgi:TolA-binding protein
MERNYEAYFGFQRLVDNYPQHRHIEQFRYAAFTQGIACDYLSEAMGHGEYYLAEPSYLLFEKPVAVQLASLYARFEAVEKLSILADDFLHRFPFEPVAAQMSHYLGQAFLKKGMVNRIIEDFPFWIAEYPDGAFIDSASYWIGMAYLFSGDFESALSAFNTLLANYPGSVYFKEASFRRGVAHFGLGQYAEAREVFESWLSDSSGHPLVSEAYVFMGDLDAMDARVERALMHYRLVETHGGALAMIEHAYFESAALLLANKRHAEHDGILEEFLNKYPESASCAEAILRMAEAALDQGRVPEAFACYRDGIERFGNDSKSDDVDVVIDSWWEQDSAIRAGAAETAAFIEALLGDESFRARMLYDRIAQISYFQQHEAIDPEVKELLTIRHPLYGELAEHTDAAVAATKGRALSLENYPALGELLARNQARLAKLPPEKPARVFRAMYAAAVAAGQETLALRLLRVMNQRDGEAVETGQFTADWVESASPASKVWIARLIAEEDGERAITILTELVSGVPDSVAAAEGLFLLGELESQRHNHEAAQAYHNRVLEEHFTSVYARRSAILRGDALRQTERLQEAVEAYALVLNQREWRGEVWAEASFKMGECFAQLEDLAKAQGFYERTYLAFSAFPDWSGKAVLASAGLLEAMGDSDSAQRTYQYFLDLPTSKASPYYDAIRRKRLTP